MWLQWVFEAKKRYGLVRKETFGTLLTMLNKSDAKSSRKCPWAVGLENMAMPSARRRSSDGRQGRQK
jgi:hypothetical protein